ncbi:DNA polymerase III subunit alpha [bacterium]|nr:DNA polymerase III subunit alpha [bacterium]
MQYVPLHLHTENSLLDGAIRLKELCEYAKENELPAIAITDHGVMYGNLEFYRTAKEYGVKPLLGCEFYVYDGDITERDSTKTRNYHLVLIAKDKAGYQNLVKLTSIAHVDGFYRRPRINHRLLEQYNEGLICLSACVQGEVARYILDGDVEKAEETAHYYKNLFKDDYYIEIQDHGLDVQKRSNPDLIRIAKKLNIPLVITNDSHYMKKEDAQWHDTLLAIQTNSLIDDPDRFRFPNNEFYVKNIDELRDAFHWLDAETFDEAIANTVKVAEKCHLVLEMGKSPLPHYEVPPTYTIETYLNHLVRKGLKEKYGEITPELDERCKYELGVIENMGFSAYFLITWDFINFAKTNGIPVGPGRGSAAGSLIAYALGITELDPMKHHLLFERFLNPERISMPDVDIDFCIERRGEVIDYVTEKYGADRVCQIITFGTLAARNALKSVARAMDIPFSEANELAQLIPAAPKTKIDDALVDGMELKERYKTDERVKKLVDMAKAIEGLKVNVGTHAAGVIISHVPLNEVVPVQPSKDGIIVTEYPMADLEKLGLLKMDFLGLRNLTIIKNTLDLIKARTGEELEINKIPLDDQAVYDLLMSGETDGVFQLESAGMKKLIKDLKPSVFEDLGALVALFRPGPLDSGMVAEFVERKHGRKVVTYPHPLLEPILKDTYGSIVYQEQIMQIFQVLAGYSLGGADMVRRMMGKKKLDEMAKQKEKFIEGAGKNGMAPKDATELFEQIEKFASYCFNRSHSAAYAFVAYQTAYLKTHYPVEYMSALLTSVSGDADKTQAYISNSQDMGIKVLAPDINKSNGNFTPDGDVIRFGLLSIKNVGGAVVLDIEKERKENGPFKSLYDFCCRIDPKCLNKRTLESLIKAGAFANIEKSRKQLMENLDAILSTTAQQNSDKQKGQTSLFAVFDESSAFSTSNFQLTGSDEEFSDKQIQTFEKELLGFYVTSHPLSSIRSKLPFLTTHNIADLFQMPKDKAVTICGLLTGIRQIPTKKDPTKFLKVGTIEDLSGKIEFVAFHKTLEQYNSLLTAESKVIISGKVNKRDEESAPSVAVDTVKSVDNSNVVTITLKRDFAFEEIVALKDYMAQFKGSDPLIIKLKENDKDVKILCSSSFWVNATNDFINATKNTYKDSIEISIKSLDGE